MIFMLVNQRFLSTDTEFLQSEKKRFLSEAVHLNKVDVQDQERAQKTFCGTWMAAGT